MARTALVSKNVPLMWQFYLKALMEETPNFCLVGNDDSGPEDIEDDLDLECESLPPLKILFSR